MAANGKTIIPTSKKLTTGSGKLRGSLIVEGWIVVGWIWVGWIDAVRWVAMGVVWWLFGGCWRGGKLPSYGPTLA